MEFNNINLQDLQLQHSIEVNPSSGSVAGIVNIPLSEGRNGFGPSLSLQYNSSSRNSVFGIGWSLSGIPFIAVDTKKGLPKYDGTDEFAYNGGLSLLPRLLKTGTAWTPHIAETADYWIYYYRPKQEEAFTRFERWVKKTNGAIHWRTKSKENVTSIFGLSDTTISDPEDPRKTFMWLLEWQYDPLGNAIHYLYKSEDQANVNPFLSYECSRLKKFNSKGFAQKYPERILYGNTLPLLPDQAEPPANKWLFETVFDYGEYANRPFDSNQPASGWPTREDPFSSYQSGFEIRTYRLCQRLLMYHHVKELSQNPSLRGIFACQYHEATTGTTLEQISYTGVRCDLLNGTYSEKQLPPLSFRYSEPALAKSFKAAIQESTVNVPQGFNHSKTQFIDLFGEGLPGILTEAANTWYYKPNLGNGNFGKQEIVAQKPSQELGVYFLGDFDRNGNLNLFSLQGRTAGYYEYDRHQEKWSGFTTFPQIPHVGPAKFIDVDADGYPDLLLEREDKIVCFPFKGKEGFGSPFEFSKPVSNGVAYAPMLGDNLSLDYFMADMTGDGLPDQVCLRSGRVEYYPNLGNGRFGEAVLMANPPVFDFDHAFDASRIRLYDLDGSGTSDIIYLGRGEIRYWHNASGNSFVEGGSISNLPYIDLISQAQILDFLGEGTPCLVWSNSLSYASTSPIQYLKLTGGKKPRLMTQLDNGIGALIQIKYGYSGSHYLESQNNGAPWVSKIPSHFTVADQKIVIDTITNSRIATTFKYSDGHYDGNERSFVCFGRIEQYDVETFENGSLTHEKDYTQPSCTKTWLHPGMFGWDSKKAKQCYYKDVKQPFLPPSFFERTDALTDEEFIVGYRSLAGKVLRQEIFAVNKDGNIEEHPFSVTQRAYAIRKIQPSAAKQDGSFYSFQTEALDISYDRITDDPKISHHLSIDVDDFGNITKELSIAYARRNSTPAIHNLQNRDYITLGLHALLNTDTSAKYQIGALFESKYFEVNHIARSADEILNWKEVKAGFDSWTNNAIAFDKILPTGGSTVARQIEWNRIYFWNDTQTDVLPLGQTGKIVLAHHEETACFNDDLIDEVFNGKVTNVTLSNADEGNYVLKDGYWWQRTPINHFNDLSGFYSPDKIEKQPGVFTTYEYDDYYLAIVKITDPLGNKTKGEIDYNVVEPYHLTDVNDNVSEVLYDALGVPVVTTYQGSVLHQGSNELYGNDLIGTYSIRNDESFDNIIANPELYLQNASSFLFYDLNSFPLRSIRLARENLIHDGKGKVSNTAVIQIELDYQDGFGRIIQNKRKVEPGRAIQRKPDGLVNTDAAGEPILTNSDDRWLVSGHVVYNNKQFPVRQFEPFFSGTHLFENDTVLENYGVSIQQYYDAVGRMYRTDFPDSTFSEMLFTPWEVKSFDQNDTVDRSMFKVFREIQPVGSPERMALDKSLAHKETPTIIQFDPLGRAIVRVEINNNGTVRKIETQFDISGNPLYITDARGLTAFNYQRDMLGRLLYEKSMDAGEKWSFHNNDDQTIHLWDSRNVHQRTRYDALDRITGVHVDGALGLNQITERFVYGEDSSIVQAKQKNLRGALVIQYDQAGVQELKLAAPGNLPLHIERRLLNQFANDPDWTNPAAVALAPDVFTSILEYDGLGRPIEQQLPDQAIRKYVFSQGGGLQKILLSTSDGVLNNIEVLKNSSYDAKGLRQTVRLGNDVEISYTYDTETFRMKRLWSRKTTGTPRIYQDIHYTYDPMGNLVHLVDEAQQPTALNPRVLEGLNVSAHSEFEYDALYQLISATGRVHQALLQNDYVERSYEAGVPANWGKGTRHITLNNGAAVERYTRTYEYDESGNIKTIKHTGTTQNWTKQIWTSATSNRSLPLLDLNGIVVSNPENRFDANGNCSYMPHLRNLEWNYRNNISKAIIIDRSAQGKPNDEEYYVYGGDGMRVRKITQRVVDTDNDTIELIEKIYLDGCEIKRITRGGTEILKRFTSTISDGDNIIARAHYWEKDTQALETDNIAKKKIHYQLANHLGSASLELDEQGDVITYEEYFPYGGTAFIAGRNKWDIDLREYRYSSKERDDFTGLYYFGYRYYAHWIGGWINPDPLGPEDSENLYLYVQNNPINVVDPNGLQSNDHNELIRQVFARVNLTAVGQDSNEYGGITEFFAGSILQTRLTGVFQTDVRLGVIRNDVGVIIGASLVTNEFERTDLESVYNRELGSYEIQPRTTPRITITPETPPPTRPTSRRRSTASRPATPPSPSTAEPTPDTVAPEPEREETPPPVEPEVAPPETPVQEESAHGSVSESTSTNRESRRPRVPGSGTAYGGSELVSRNPSGFTLEVPNNFDDEKIRMYTERVRTDRGVGNRSAVPGERLSPRGSDVTDVLRRDNADLLDDWVDAERAAGRTRPLGNHVDHGVELQHIIRGNQTGGADTVRFEDHRFQPGGVNTSQGSSAMHTRNRAVAAGAPVDVPAGGVARTRDMGLLRNAEGLRTFGRGAGRLFTIGGPVLSWYGASQISDQRIRYVAYTTVGAEAIGLGTYSYGRWALNGANGFSNGLRVMGTGSRFMRVGGGAGMIITSVYSGVEHIEQGEYGVVLGDAAGTGLGYMMLTQSGSGPLVAVTGTAMGANYAGDYVESRVTPEYGRGAGIAAGTATGLGIGAVIGGGLVAFGLVSNPVGWGILAVGGIAGLVGAIW